MDTYCTVRELIEKLSKFPPDATVGVRAGCCLHAHEIAEVRAKGDSDHDDESDVVIDAT